MTSKEKESTKKPEPKNPDPESEVPPSIQIDQIRIGPHPDHFGPVLLLASGDRHLSLQLGPPEATVHSGKAIPHALPEGAIQKLFDELWASGLRPTGMKVYMEVAPGGSAQAAQTPGPLPGLGGNPLPQRTSQTIQMTPEQAAAFQKLMGMETSS